MELVSGGDLLSSLTGEPQVYEERGADFHEEMTS